MHETIFARLHTQAARVQAWEARERRPHDDGPVALPLIHLEQAISNTPRPVLTIPTGLELSLPHVERVYVKREKKAVHCWFLATDNLDTAHLLDPVDDFL
jgi:hypothetical protein